MPDFTFDGYIALLNYIKQKGYKIGKLSQFPDTGPAVILRHDIDFSVKHALNIAQLEANQKIYSSFFVLLTSPFYNALSPDNVAILKKIIQLGHEVGLHYDATFFENMTNQQMTDHVVKQISLLESFLEVTISTISQHKPATSKIRPSFSNFIDAYDPKYSTEIAYLSDSRMQFGTNNVRIFFDNHPRSQLLIHPIWWHKNKLSRKEIFDSLKVNISTDINHQIDDFHYSIETYLNTRSESIQHS